MRDHMLGLSLEAIEARNAVEEIARMVDCYGWDIVDVYRFPLGVPKRVEAETEKLFKQFFKGAKK